jgi:WD40 repeat protein
VVFDRCELHNFCPAEHSPTDLFTIHYFFVRFRYPLSIDIAWTRILANQLDLAGVLLMRLICGMLAWIGLIGFTVAQSDDAAILDRLASKDTSVRKQALQKLQAQGKASSAVLERVQDLYNRDTDPGIKRLAGVVAARLEANPTDETPSRSKTNVATQSKPASADLGGTANDATLNQAKVTVTRQSGMAKHSKDGSVEGMAFSADGKLFASISSKPVVHIYDIAKDETLMIETDINSYTNNAFPTSLIFTPDNKKLIFGGYHGVQVVDTQTGEGLGLFGEKRRLYDCKFPPLVSPDGSRLITIARSRSENELSTWDLSTNQLISKESLPGSNDSSQPSRFTPDGRCLVMAINKDLAILDGKTGKKLSLLTNLDSNGIKDFIMPPDVQQAWVAINSKIQPISLKNPESPRLLKPMSLEFFSWQQLQFNEDGSRLFAHNWGDGSWSLLDRATLKPIASFPRATHVRMASKGNVAVLFNKANQQILILDPKTGQEKGFISVPVDEGRRAQRVHPMNENHLVIDPRGQYVAYTPGFGGEIFIKPLGKLPGGTQAKAQVAQLPSNQEKPYLPRNAMLSQDGSTILVLGDHGFQTMALDAKTLKVRTTLRQPLRPKELLNEIHDGVIMPDGKKALVIANVIMNEQTEGRHRLLSADLVTGQTKMIDPKSWYNSIFMTADGKHMTASVHEAGTEFPKLIYQPQGGKVTTLVAKAYGPYADVARPRLSPDGKWFTCYYTDGKNLTYDAIEIKTGESGPLAGNPQPTFATFLNDNKTFAVVSGSSNVSLIYFDVTTGQEIRRLDSINKTLTGGNQGVVPSPSGEQILTYSDGRDAFLLSAKKGEVLTRLSGFEGHLTLGRFTNDGKRILGFTSSGEIRIWDLK